MANRLLIKNSTVGGTVPASLDTGEIAVNTADAKLWVGDSSNTPKEIGKSSEVVDDLTPQLGGDLDCNGKVILGSSYREIAAAVLSDGDTYTFDFALGDYQKVTAPAGGTITIAVANLPTGAVSTFMIEAISWGDATIIWPATIQMDMGIFPDMTSGADVLLLTSSSSGLKVGKAYSDSRMYTKPIPDGADNPSIVDAIPAMTSNTAPSGEVSATAVNTANAYKAVSALLAATYTSKALPNYWQYMFDTAIAINKYTVAGYMAATTPKDWTLVASDTGAFAGEETLLNTVTGHTGQAAATFTFANGTAFKYYRFLFTKNGGGATVTITNITMTEAQP